jgi:hypothetical protein
MKKVILLLSGVALFLLIGLVVFMPGKGQTQNLSKKELSSEQLEMIKQRVEGGEDVIPLDPDTKGDFAWWGYLEYAGVWDYYSLVCGEGTLEIHLTSIPEFSDFDLYLFDCNGYELARSWNSGNQDEEIIEWVSTDTYNIGVYCYSGWGNYLLYGYYVTPPKLPDLILQSLTSSDYNPTIEEQITITLTVKNQGDTTAWGFWTDLFEDEMLPPGVGSTGDYYWRIYSLDPGSTVQFSQVVTNDEVETWHMYGLTDSYGEITEKNECNNLEGPVDVVWCSKPDLIVEDFCIGTSAPEIGDWVNVIVVIKNQGGDSAYNFYTDLFYDSPYPPTPPADGDDDFYTSSLSPGETKAWAFYIGNGEAEEWSMYVLVDSRDSVDEGDEYNNLWGPEYVTWSYFSSPPSITREEIIQNAWEYVQVLWQCPYQNAYPPDTSYCVDPNNDQTWSSDFVVGTWYTGEAYEWGGWDKVDDFLDHMDYDGQRAGVHQGNDCLPNTLSNPCWSTGIDCSGLVSRCWELSYKRSTRSLFDVAHEITYDSLKMGDALDDTTAQNYRHVRLFFDRPAPGWIRVFESISYGVVDTANGCDTNRYLEQEELIDRDYIAIRYNNVYDPPNNDPVIQGPLHCKYPQEECGDFIKLGEEMTIEIFAHDPDGDPLQYEWSCYWGYFIVNGSPVPACTTLENYILYQAPGSSWWPEHLTVYVRDNRGWLHLDNHLIRCL